MNAIKYCLLTNDVETTSIWHNSLRANTGLKVLNEGIPKLLELYSNYNIKSTFFFTGDIAKLYPQIVKMIVPFGHEVGSHGMSHEKKDGFDIMPLYKQVEHLKESKKILEDLSGQEVISFRAPALRISNNTVRALTEAGYKIDSSTAPQRFDFFMSFGGVKKLKWLFTRRVPYFMSFESSFKKGNSEILEIPLNSFLLPYIGTTMRLFPKLTRVLRRIIDFEYKFHEKPVLFLFHPNEIIDETNEKISYDEKLSNFLTGKLRRCLKIKNLGKKGLTLYEEQIKYFFNKEYNFVTLKKYAEQFSREIQ